VDERVLRVGVTGLGYWGPNLVRVLSEMSGVELAYVCDLDVGRLEHFARRYPQAVATTRFEDLLEAPKLDAVLIATPVNTHYELAAKSLRAHKHTFVEKPLALSGAEAAQLTQLAKAESVALMCGHTFLYSPPVREVKRLLATGELGDIHFISSSRVNLGLHQTNVSVIWDLGPHDFSILLYWLDERPDWIVAVGRDSIIKGIPDVAFMSMGFPSGLIANVELSWLAPSKLRRTAIVGSEKMVVYDDSSQEPIRIFNSGVVYKDPETFGQYQLSYRTGDILSPRLETAEPLAVELEEFAAFNRGRKQWEASAALAQDVVLLAEAAERSLLKGGVPVDVTRPS
jgi:predicted dehydrogenase